MQEQKKKLDQLQDGKTKVEKKLSAVSLDMQSQDKRTKEDQVQLDTLRQSLAQLTERQREVRNQSVVLLRFSVQEHQPQSVH